MARPDMGERKGPPGGGGGRFGGGGKLAQDRQCKPHQG